MDKQKITVRGVTYEVNPVSKVYFRGLTECLSDLGDVDNLSKSAKTIKKVIIPNISDDIIIKGDLDEEFYLWGATVEPEEINDIILNIGRCFRLQKLAEAKEKGDKDAIAEHEEGLRLIDQYLRPEVETAFASNVPLRPEETPSQSEIEQLKQELAALKNQPK